MRIKSFLIVVFSLAFFSGCASKKELVYKEVNIPIRCEVDLPKKPLNNKDFESHKALMLYFSRVEKLLFKCMGKDDE